MNISEESAVTFIKTHFRSASISDIFPESKYESFVQLVTAGKDIAAAEEYAKLHPGVELSEAHLAASVAKAFV